MMRRWLADLTAGSGMMRGLLPDLTAGLVVFLLAVAELVGSRPPSVGVAPDGLAVAAGTAAAIGAIRRAPGPAVLLVWATVSLQLWAVLRDSVTAPVLLTQAAVLVIIFGAARWGGSMTLVFSGLSLTVGAYIAVRFLDNAIVDALFGVTDLDRLADGLSLLGEDWRLSATGVLTLVLFVPWLLGLAVRISQDARTRAASAHTEIVRAEAGRAQAQQIAELREQQARLARDVHDVVGHSLTVILAQAESAQYLPDDPAALKTTFATVATSARRSLHDIREVLTATRDVPAAGELDRLIDDLASGGLDIISTQAGTPLPLAPHQATAAVRALQEMLTNAIRHGRRGGAIVVHRHWPHRPGETDLSIEVRNGAEADTPFSPGRGLTGMRERLQAVGGRLEAERRGDVFAVTARIPVSRQP
ncbi:histidine kinase [Actinoplanes sp. TRM88002]|uniref:histidine kinase n=1 Tax=Paractinoplanes hotanensis TaxID=2906497 RepID=A0ABT0Y280_9ACTN|nr:histidine kinase [Actinoplanes hotanensis]